MKAGRTEPKFLEDERGVFTASYGPYVLRSAFQPIFRQDGTGRLTIDAFEGLIRAQLGSQQVSPGHFFSHVEKQDGTAVDMLCRDLHVLNMGRIGHKTARLFVNFNPALLGVDTAITTEIEGLLAVTRKAGLRPGRIVCEITEQAGGDNATLRQFVLSLRDNLFRIAVDDFGAEGSDISRIDALNPDIIKFDAAWVRRFTETSAGKGLLRLMVERFHQRGIVILFEGIEEDAQIEFCQEIGVNLMQGYALARPQLAPTDFNIRFPETAAPARSLHPDVASASPTPQPGDGLHRAQEAWTLPQRRQVTFGRRFR